MVAPRWFVVLVMTWVASLPIACGGDGSPQDGPEPDARVVGDWTELVAADWELVAGGERFHCARRTMETDVWVTGFQPLAPVGTHHTAAAAGPPSGPDESFPCDPKEGGNAELALFASGVGTDSLIFPDGVALRIPAGMQITVNLHLYNTGEQTIGGRSGMMVRTIPAEDVVEEAMFVAAGSESPSIPATNEPVTAGARCAFAEEVTIHDLWPHMHQIGRRMTVELGEQIVFDEPYSFEEQRHYPMLLVAPAGTEIRATCTWINDTGVTVEPGNSSDQEMCVLGMYVSPATAFPSCDGL